MLKKYIFTIILLDKTIVKHTVFCTCPIDWVVDNYEHDEMLDWGWIEIKGGSND